MNKQVKDFDTIVKTLNTAIDRFERGEFIGESISNLYVIRTYMNSNRERMIWYINNPNRTMPVEQPAKVAPIIEPVIQKVKKEANVKPYTFCSPALPVDQIITQLNNILKPVRLDDVYNLLEIKDLPSYFESYPQEIGKYDGYSLDQETFLKCRDLFKNGSVANAPYMVSLFCNITTPPEKTSKYQKFMRNQYAGMRYRAPIEGWLAYVIRCGILQKNLGK